LIEFYHKKIYDSNNQQIEGVDYEEINLNNDQKIEEDRMEEMIIDNSKEGNSNESKEDNSKEKKKKLYDYGIKMVILKKN